MKPETEKFLEINEKRHVSQSTKITCAHCGGEFNIDNRHLLPFTFEKINDSIGRIWMPCPRCDNGYDLGICRIDKSPDVL